MDEITLNDLTEGKIDGNGVFDKLMQVTKAHLDAESKKGAIKGAEYSEVYLGQVQAVLNTAVQFLTIRPKIALEAELIREQIELVKSQVKQTEAQTLQTEAQTKLAIQQELNEQQQLKVLVAQECLLKSQFNNMQATVIKTGAETALLNQKTATEKAQILGLGVDADSVIGRQKALYVAQTDGFRRDAEQKAAKVLIDTWNVRRTTDDGTVADGINMLNDSTIGRAVKALMDGIQA